MADMTVNHRARKRKAQRILQPMLSPTAATGTVGTSPVVKSAIMALILAPLAFFRMRIQSPSNAARHEQIIASAPDAHHGKLLDPLGRPNPICRSMYQTSGASRSSPLVFERDKLMVCQNPKVGSTEMRCIHAAYCAQEEFSMEPKFVQSCNPKHTESLLKNFEDKSTFNDYLYSDSTSRIMLVRHPVRRIVSGFIQVSRAAGRDFWELGYKIEGDLGYGPEAFHTWVLNSTFMFQYDPVCSHASTYFSQHPWFQHYAAPQHCRCGIWDCGVEWKIFKIEEVSVASVMEQYVPGKWISPGRQSRIDHETYDEEDYLAPEVLDVLNRLTQVEQEFFGYEPLTFV